MKSAETMAIQEVYKELCNIQFAGDATRERSKAKNAGDMEHKDADEGRK
jgi:hypothetical protein